MTWPGTWCIQLVSVRDQVSWYPVKNFSLYTLVSQRLGSFFMGIKVLTFVLNMILKIMYFCRKKKHKNFKSIWIIMILSSKCPSFSFTIVHFIMQLYEIISHAKLIPSSPRSSPFQALYYYWQKICYHISHIEKKIPL